jgi:hypothetical protein
VTKGGGDGAYDPDLEVGGEAAEDGALRRRCVLLRSLRRHRGGAEVRVFSRRWRRRSQTRREVRRDSCARGGGGGGWVMDG